MSSDTSYSSNNTEHVVLSSEDSESIDSYDEESLHAEVPCILCGFGPCRVVTYRKEIEHIVYVCNKLTERDNVTKRNMEYNYLLIELYDNNGKGRYMLLPICIRNKIENVCPDEATETSMSNGTVPNSYSE